MRRLKLFLKLCRLVWFTFPLWREAVKVVKEISQHTALQSAAVVEPNISFCPMCGQRPQDDRRKDEARSRLVAKSPNERRSSIDAVLSLAHWAAK